MHPNTDTTRKTQYGYKDNRGSFKDVIRLLYGERTLAKVNDFSKLRTSLAKLLSTLAFLKRCRDSNIVPKFLQLKNHVGTRKSKEILHKTGIILTKERIHHTKSQINKTSQKTFQLHLLLSTKLRPDIWQTLDRITYEQAERNHTLSTERQKQKYQKLNPPTQNQPPPQTVRNLSNRNLTPDELSALTKGPNFAVAPSKIPKEEIISQVEAVMYKFTTEEANYIRRQTADILHKAKPPPPNTTRQERLALRELNKDTNIIVLPADKGNTTVIMNTADYHKKIKALLDDKTYTKLNRDPTDRITRDTNALIEKTTIPKEDKRMLKPRNPLPPRLYGLPKIHKPNIPLRPIVSTINSPTYNLARYLARKLQPLVGKTGTHISNSTEFIKKINSIRLQPRDILVSFDVESLFTRVPIKDTLELIKTSPEVPPNLIPLIEHCLTTTYFSFNNQYYEQNSGAAMGSPLSPVIANIFMEHFEKEALSKSPKKPEVWYRYVDDTFVVWRHGRAELRRFLIFLNTLHPNIRFTMETEEDGTIPFLDVLVTKKEDYSLGHQVYRKPTHTDRYLHAMSHHHPSQKQSVINSLVHRARAVADEEHLQRELDHVKETLKHNGYEERDINKTINRLTRKEEISNTQTTQDCTQNKKTFTVLPYIKGTTDRIDRILRKHNIRTVFKPPMKIGQILRNPKDQRPPLSSAGVYRIPCSCGKAYIGETGRRVDQRRKEHQRDVRLKHFTQSALSEHNMETGHQIQFDQTTTIATTSSWFPRKYREALEIYKHPNNLNRDRGIYISDIWKTVIPVSRSAS